MIAQHSSKNDAWMTPVWLIEAARDVLGTIDLDPASTAEANLRVKATYLYGAPQNNDLVERDHHGIAQIWGSPEYPQNVWCNPPGGKTGPAPKDPSRTALFWDHLLEERTRGHINHALFLLFNIEGLRTCRHATSFPFCIFDKRIAFDNPDGSSNRSPTHANALIYVPGHADCSDVFAETFQSHGSICGPWK